MQTRHRVWPQNEKAIADFVKGPWPFGDLPEKVCSLAWYCRKRKQQGLPLTPAQERFFQHLVDLHQHFIYTAQIQLYSFQMRPR